MTDEITAAADRLIALHHQPIEGRTRPAAGARPTPIAHRSAGGAAIPSRGPAGASRGGGDPRPPTGETTGATPLLQSKRVAPSRPRRRRWPPDLAAIPVFAGRMAALASIRTRPRSTTP